MAPVAAATPPSRAAFFKFLPVAIFLALFPNPRALRLNPANPDRPRAPRVKAPNLGPTLRNTRGNDLRRAPKSCTNLLLSSQTFVLYTFLSFS